MAGYEVLSVAQDAKTIKGRQFGYETGILYLAPATEADGFTNLCTFATAECKQACLYGQGMAKMWKSIKRNRIAKTLRYLQNQKAFMRCMARDVVKLARKARRQGLIAAVRPNGTSDLPKMGMQLAAEFPDIQFYDYTKIPRPWLRQRKNYQITFSFSGSNLPDALECLAHGVNVAVVFAVKKGKALPETWQGYRVIDGDISDLRFLDPRGVVVGLRAKGDAKQLPVGGFVQSGELIQIGL